MSINARPKFQDLDRIRAQNRRNILQCIRDSGEISRVDISSLVDVSPATVSVVTGELLVDGLIETVEQHGKSSGRGRPKRLLRLRPGAAYAIGIKFALHQASVSITNFVGDVLASDSLPIAPSRRAPGQLVDICEQQIDRMLGLAGLEPHRLLGVGIGVSGCVAHETGTVVWSPMFAERNFPLRAAIEERTGLRVAVDNEANLAGLAEKWFGLGRTYPSFILATVEHGVGMSVVIDHQIHRGWRGFAGELGHMTVDLDGAECRCGKKGCVEAYVADYAMVREARALVGDVPVRDQQAVQDALDALASRADVGERDAAEIFVRAGHVFGVALANAVNLLDPPMIIIGGQRAAHPARVFIESLERSMRDNIIAVDGGVPPVEVRAWGDDTWARGAAALVLEEFMPHNSPGEEEVATATAS